MPSDRDASISDAAFREALTDYTNEVSDRSASMERNGTYRKPSPAEVEARARVLALYAEAQQQGERDQLALAEQVAEATVRMEQGRAERQGEEQVKTVMYGEAYVLRPRKDGAIILWPDGDYRVLRELKPGDRVRVVKEGT